MINPSFKRCADFMGVTSPSVVEPQTSDIKSNQLARRTLESQGNGDFILDSKRMGIYCGIDLVGGIRQMAAAAQSVSLLVGQSAVAVARAAAPVVPFGLLISGPAVMVTASIWTIPDALEAVRSAKEEVEEAQDKKATKEGKHALEIAKLGVANHLLFFAMGAAQTVSGAVLMMTPEVARVLHYTPLLTHSVAFVALAASNVALGAAYTIRGGVMLTRTIKAYIPVRKFRISFHKALKEPTTVMGFLEDKEKRGATYFERRVDPACLECKDKKGDVVGRYTPKGLQDIEGNIVRSDLEVKKEYLKRVDKGIYTQELKHKVAMVIACAMIIGGITAIVLLSVLTLGIAPLIIALVSAVFFMSMEYIFFTYDSTPLFEKLRDRLYTPHKDLSMCMDELQKAQKTFSILDQMLRAVERTPNPLSLCS